MRKFVCRAWVTNPDGSRRYPSKGKRAICWWVEDPEPTGTKKDLTVKAKSL